MHNLKFLRHYFSLIHLSIRCDDQIGVYHGIGVSGKHKNILVVLNHAA